MTAEAVTLTLEKTRQVGNLMQQGQFNMAVHTLVEVARADDSVYNKVKENLSTYLLKGDIDGIGKILDFGWQHKKQMAKSITNEHIDKLYETALNAGASGGKISGAGGGGFMFFYCPENSRYSVIEALSKFGGQAKRYEFTTEGLKTWTM